MDHATFDRLDARITGWMAARGITWLRVSVGVVFLWFGALKLVPGLSPAEEVAGRTFERLTFGAMPASVGVIVIGAWEVAIGVGLLTAWALRATLLLLFVQMVGALTPLVLFPGLCFERFPFVLTLLGQYIVKNAVLVSAAIAIGATVRGGGLSARRARPSVTSPPGRG